MESKVRDLIDDVVWDASGSALDNISESLRIILKTHVSPMLLPKVVGKRLSIWAHNQMTTHVQKSILMSIKNAKLQPPNEGLARLCAHHDCIALRYKAVWAEIEYSVIIND